MAKKVTSKKVIDWRPKNQVVTNAQVKRFLYGLMREGNVTAAAKYAHANRTALYQRKARDPEFAACWEECLEIGVCGLEDHAHSLAVNGWEEPVFHDGDECGTKTKFSPALIIFLLKAHNPAKYRERFEIEHGGKGGGPLAFEVIMDPQAVAEAAK